MHGEWNHVFIKKNISGVPQGSIVGSLRLLLYINDMPKCLRNNSISIYADDTKIYNSSSDSSVLIAKTNGDLEYVSQWITDNKLQFFASLNTSL